jgi:signal transduction histidine kinase
MKSIRVSLIVYFLVLLAVVFGTASVLVYRNAVKNLEDKQEADRKWRKLRYEVDCDKVKNDFEAKLESTAHEVAIRAALTVTTRLGSGARIRQLLGVGLINDGPATLLAPFYYNPGPFPPGIRNPVSDQVSFLQSRVDSFDEERFPQSANPAEPLYYQINFSWNTNAWLSTSMGNQALPFSIDNYAASDFFPHTEDMTLPLINRRVRRVVLKQPVDRPVRIGFGSPRGRGDGRGGGRGGDGRGGRGDGRGPVGRSDEQRGGPGPPRVPPSDRPSPVPGLLPVESDARWIVVYCAMEPTQLETKLAELAHEYEVSSQELQAEAQHALAALRRRLLLLGLGTFLGTTLGGSLLVSLGLAPLRRLTDAVSRVTHKDFRLPLAADKPLPTELDPIRHRLQDTLDLLRKAFEREKQASADISHELRTPVASLLTAIEVSLKKQRSAAEYRQTLEDCRITARQMRHLVERLMALARLDAGSDRVRPREVDVGQLVSECATLVRPLAGERGLELRVHCPKAVTWTTDPDKLREVIVNLLHNAIQYNQPAGAVDLSAQADNGWLDLQVHDTGQGIAPEAFGHIFERFYRSDPSRSGSELHAGLGLSIVKGYVGLLGGTITVESQVGQGSTFRVRLPAVGQAA